MSKGIDYSKWDKLQLDSSGSDDESDCSGHDEPSRRANVTKLSYPSRITVGPNGVTMEDRPPKSTASPFQPTPLLATGNAPHSPSPEVGARPAQRSNTRDSPAVTDGNEADEVEDELMYQNLVRNGARVGQSHLWSQTRDSVTVSIILPGLDVKAKDIVGFRIFATSDQSILASAALPHSGIGHAPSGELPDPAPNSNPGGLDRHVFEFHLRISAGGGHEGDECNEREGGITTCRAVLRYPVKLDDDLLLGCWQLQTLPALRLRLLVVNVMKENFGTGVSLWWDQCFDGDRVRINTQDISDRRDMSVKRAEDMQRVWQEAHEEFRKRVRERKQAPVVLDD